jgi:Domain of unknown function (DUF3943)
MPGAGWFLAAFFAAAPAEPIEPLAEPTAPTAEPIAEPTAPTAEPIAEPTAEPIAEPTAEPIAEPTAPTAPATPVKAAPTGPRPHYAVDVFETALALTGGLIWYWNAAQFNSRDWDLAWDQRSWKSKLITFEAPRFDDNTFDTNAFWHPGVGMGIYAIARGNHISPLKALAISAISSVVWEYTVEFREYPSVNDMIFTPMAAISLAEPAARLAAFLRAGSHNLIAEGFADLLDPVAAVNARFEHAAPRDVPVTDDWGVPVEYRHRLELFAALGDTDFGGGVQHFDGTFGADIFLDSTPGFGLAGERRRLVGTGALTFLAGGVSFADSHLVAAGLAGKVALGGVQWRRYEATFEPKPRGHVLFLGLGTGFEYATRRTPGFPSDDRLGIVRIAGPMVDWGLARGNVSLHAQADASWDFAMVHPLAGDDYLASASPDGLPTVLTREGYYYAQGLSLTGRLVAAYGRWETGVDVGEDDFRPLHVLDRNGSAGPPPATADRRARRRLWGGVRPWQRVPLAVTVGLEHMVREGRMSVIERSHSELRASTAVSLMF